MEEGSDEYEMQNLDEMYSKYDDMDYTTLGYEYDIPNRESLNLLRDDYPNRPDEDKRKLDEVKSTLRYIENLRNAKYAEKTFTSNDYGKTITIKRKTLRSISAPEVQFITPEVRPINIPTNAVQDFIHRNYKENFRFDLNNDRAIELRLNINRTGNNNITYRPLTTRNERGAEQIVLKRDSNGVLQYNDAKSAERAVEQFKEEIEKIIDEQIDRENTVRDMPMIETTINQQDDIPGLTPQENREVAASLVAGRTNSELQNLGEDADLDRNVVKSRFAGL